jgi:hypothetical protein
MKRFLQAAIAILIFGAIIALPVSCARWRYNECRAVGHSWGYCFMDFMSEK